MTTLNEAHVGAFAHFFVGLGMKREASEKISRLLGSGLWNRQQDALLAMLACCQKTQASETNTTGFDALVAKIHRTTEREHATVFYHVLLKLGLKEQDAAQLARFFARNLSNKNCDSLKTLLLDGVA